MQRVISASLMIAMAMSAAACSQDADTALSGDISARTEVDSAHFPVRRCINMGNALEAETEGAWGYTIKAAHFRIIVAAGFDTVRIPIRWDIHTDAAPPYSIDPVFMTRVKTVARQAHDAGLGVIIDVHHYEGLMEHTKREMPRYLAIWDQISDTFQDAPENLYFEIINEPISPMTMDKANDIYARVIPRIRTTHPKRAIIFGGDDWNNVHSLKEIEFPDDPYLVATFHDYEPYKFTHQGASWSENPPPTGRKWGKRKDIKDLSSDYKRARAFQADVKRPVFVGEFGVIDTLPHDQRAQWLEARRRMAETSGFSWCVWDFGGAFELYDTKAERWHPHVIEALMTP